MKKTLTKIIAILLIAISLISVVGCVTDDGDNEDRDWSVYDDRGKDVLLGGGLGWSVEVFGVEVAVWLYGKQGQKNIGAATEMFKELKREVQKLDAQCSTTYTKNISAGRADDSDIVKFNRAGKNVEVPIGEYTKIMYDMSLELYEDSDGLFDPCSFNVVDYWGFAPYMASQINPPLYDGWGGDVPRHPLDYPNGGNGEAEEQYTDAPADMLPALDSISHFKDKDGNLNVLCYLAQTGPNAGKWVLKKTTDDVIYTDTRTNETKTYRLRLDFGAVAKGYAADIGRDLAEKYCITKGYINVNSSQYVLKAPNLATATESEATYPVTVNDPRKYIPSGLGYVSVGIINPAYKFTGLSTSADSEKFYWYPDQASDTRYCHILNPVTMYPANIDPATEKNYASCVISATIFHASAAMTDAYATIAILMGQDGNWQAAADWLEERNAHCVLIEQTLSGTGSATYKLHFVNMDADNFTVSDPLVNIYKK